jgi:hypothetical protein
VSTECRLVLAGILIFAGCASAPEQSAEKPIVPTADASTAPPASGAATAPETEGTPGDTAAVATIKGGVPAVEIAKLADTNPVTCRDMLIHGSNVLRTQCMTRNDWKVYDQAQRIWAQDMLLRMQGLKR